MTAGMLLIIISWLGHSATGYTTSSLKTVSVKGEAQTEVEPDLARVRVSVITRAITAKKAQAENAKIVSKVQRLLKNDFRLDQKDRATAEFHVHADYKWQGGENKFTGFRVTHGLAIQLKETQKLGELLDKLTQAGVNQISSIQFDTSQRTKIMSKLLTRAVKDARAKAEKIASAADMKIKKILNIGETQSHWGPKLSGGPEAASFRAAPTEVVSGSLQLQREVTMILELD